jgi:hypothetical protein
MAAGHYCSSNIIMSTKITTPDGIFSVRTKPTYRIKIGKKENAREWVVKMRRDAAHNFTETVARNYHDKTFWKTVEVAMSKLLQVGEIDTAVLWSDVSSQLKRTFSANGYDEALKQLWGIE